MADSSENIDISFICKILSSDYEVGKFVGEYNLSLITLD